MKNAALEVIRQLELRKSFAELTAYIRILLRTNPAWSLFTDLEAPYNGLLNRTYDVPVII